MKVIRFGLAAVLAGVFGVLAATGPVDAALSDKELKCTGAVSKNLAKLQTSLLKIRAACHADDISGELDSADACETLSADDQEKVDKAKNKFVSSIAKACHGQCSSTDSIDCISDLSCPANHQAAPPNNNIAESCAWGGSFSIFNLDWPGPYCEAVLGHSLKSPEDLGTCLASLVDRTVESIDEAVYSSLDETSGLTEANAKCAASIAKALPQAVARSYTATAKCRDARVNDADPAPYACPTQDEKVAVAIQKNLDKLSGTVEKFCSDGDIAALTGLCATGGANPSTIAGAQSCLGDLVREIGTEERSGHRHVYSELGLLNISHPDSAIPYCGDGIVQSTREESTGVGEECDVGADSACPGNCLPPGDLFQCTCSTTARERFVIDNSTGFADSDAGWTGDSHDATHNDGFGYVTEFSNCNCSAFTGATCTGSTSDSVCDVYGNMAPRCSDDPNGTETCADRGDGDPNQNNWDCYVCDGDSLNAGTYCGTNAGLSHVNETVCQSQCIDDLTGLPVVPADPCQNQSECAEGSTCRGRCDSSIRCLTMTEGSPLPLVSGATPVCVMLEYRTDITGTKDIVTGEQGLQYSTRSLISLGILAARPCPVCTGVCLGGADDGDVCMGRCDVSNAECLVDGDCTAPGDTACLATDDDCTGGTCALDLRCSAGPNAGKLCRVDASTPLGVVSHDCPASNNLASFGVPQNFGTVTTEAVQLPTPTPCSDPTWQNFDCPCPANNLPTLGVPTRPNKCAGACDGGVNAGNGCAVGQGGTGEYTTCLGGMENGLPCNDNLDCPGGSCTDQPTECVSAGTPDLLGASCVDNSDCGMGGLCGDPCPGAKCVPLCLQEGICNGGARNGRSCSTTDHCKQCTAGNPLLIGTPCDTNVRCNSTESSADGVCSAVPGVTCDLSDPEDGICAAGPWKFRCNGAGYTSIPCTLEYGTCTSGNCTKGSPSQRNTPCTVNSDCIDNVNVPVSSGCETGTDSLPGTADDIPGSGECEPVPQDCFVNNGFAEGGDTLNGQGSPTDVNVNAAFCTPPNSNASVNDISGFGGPSRIRREGTATMNVPSIAP